MRGVAGVEDDFHFDMSLPFYIACCGGSMLEICVEDYKTMYCVSAKM